MFAEKEREERRKLLALAPKRASSRIERKRREQELKDRLLAEKVFFIAFLSDVLFFSIFEFFSSWKRSGGWRRSTTKKSARSG